MMTLLAVVFALLFLAGCATADRSMSMMFCSQKGIDSPECAMTRQNEDQKVQAKNTGTAVGGVLGCVLTGPFCLFGVGPALGALIGNSTSGN